MTGRITRRGLLATAGAGVIAGGAAAGAATVTFRWHQTPRRHPYLSDEHLSGLPLPEAGPKRVLFIGNSFLLQHDVPTQVAHLARAEGKALRPALAAANGARLVETARIDTLRQVMRPGMWDILVLQDFTKTPLRLTDRLGSAWAMAELAGRVAPAPVLLCPPWPARADHRIYREAGRWTTTPSDPADYAARTMRHYHAIAGDLDAPVAPVPERWLAAATAAHYTKDGHHASARGAALVAGVIWGALREML